MKNITRKERDRQLRKTDIMRAAEHVFALKGYHKATMQDIAAKAEYATGTVYLYFADKEALYFSMIEEKIKEFLVFAKEKTGKIEDGGEKLSKFLDCQIDFFEKDQDFFRIFFSESTDFKRAIDSRIDKSAVVKEFRKYMVNIMKSCQQQGLIRKEFEARQLSDIYISNFNTVSLAWLKGEWGKAGELKDMSGFILDIFLNGAGSRSKQAGGIYKTQSDKSILIEKAGV